jgi:hypothetical protein
MEACCLTALGAHLRSYSVDFIRVLCVAPSTEIDFSIIYNLVAFRLVMISRSCVGIVALRSTAR